MPVVITTDLIISVFEFGKGLWETYDEHQARWKMVQVQQDRNRIMKHELGVFRQKAIESFGRMDQQLNICTRMLTTMMQAQGDIDSRLEQLHVAMQAGFQGIAQQLINQDITAFKTKNREMVVAWQEILDLLSEGESPSDNELHHLHRLALSCKVDIDERLERLPQGDPGRLPLIVVKVLAIRAQLDVARFRAVGSRLERIMEEVEALAAMIRQEVEKLLKGATLYQIGVQRAKLLHAYSALRRGIRGQQTTWVDGLDRFRQAFEMPLRQPLESNHSAGPNTVLEVTLYANWVGKKVDDVPLRNLPSVSVGELLDRVGAPQMRVDAGAIQTLWEVGTPAFFRNIERHIEQEFVMSGFKISISPPKRVQTEKAPPVVANVNKQGSIPPNFVSPILGAMMWIPSGTFLMGSPESEKGRGSDEKQHSVTLTKGYWMMKHPVTQAQWQAVMGNNPSHFKSAGNEQCPVEKVSWDDIQEFIKKLNVRDNAQYRLPTEAEWEYAARGGQSFIYSGSNHIDEVAWYSGNSGDKTHPVCQKKPNGYGLYDMSGNVWEWVSDGYGDYKTSGGTFKADSLVDPQGNVSGSYRVFRGGGWDTTPGFARVAYRSHDTPSDRCYDLGFRLVRTIP